MDEKLYLDQHKLITEELINSGVTKTRPEAEEMATEWLNSVKNDILF